MAESSKESPRHTLQFQAQIRNYEQKLKSLGLFRSLNHYGTPKEKIDFPVNPFKDKDPEKLLSNISSPDLIENAVSPSKAMQEMPELTWTLEEVARINPAIIESPQALLDESLGEEEEQDVQRAVQRYFEESHDIITPEDWSGANDCIRKATPDDSMASIPDYGHSSSTPRVSKQLSLANMDVSMQSNSLNYSFEEQESLNSSNRRITLRRKLFHFGESPLKSDDDGLEWKFQRSEWSPTKADPPSLPSPLLSPIQNFEPSKPMDMSVYQSYDWQTSIDMRYDTGYGSQASQSTSLN